MKTTHMPLRKNTNAAPRPKRILIVDDEPLLCWTLKKVLEEDGYQATHCATVLDAMKAMRELAFDLVITDYRLPDGSGYEVAAFAKDLSGVPGIIMLTAELKDKKSTLRASGMDEVIEKPFDIDVLVQKVRNHLGTATPKAELFS